MKVTVKKVDAMEPGILEELTALLISVVEDGASIGFLTPLSIGDATEYWQHVLSPGAHLWIAVRDDRIVGTVQLHLALKPNAAHRAEVAKLMVHPSCRRSGIAKLLMQTMEQAAKAEGRHLLVLDTRSGDPSNLLYKSLGFIEAGRIPDYAKSAGGGFDETTIYYKRI